MDFQEHHVRSLKSNCCEQLPMLLYYSKSSCFWRILTVVAQQGPHFSRGQSSSHPCLDRREFCQQLHLLNIVQHCWSAADTVHNTCKGTDIKSCKHCEWNSFKLHRISLWIAHWELFWRHGCSFHGVLRTHIGNFVIVHWVTPSAQLITTANWAGMQLYSWSK